MLGSSEASKRAPLSVMSNGMRVAPRTYGAAKSNNAPKQAPVPQPQATADTATFLSFVRMLAAKPEEEQRMLVQVAMQEAASAPPPRQQRASSPTVAPGGIRRSSSAGELRRNPLRRSASVDGSDFGSRVTGGSASGSLAATVPSGGNAANAGMMIAGPDGRPRSAEATLGGGGNSAQSQSLASAWGGSALSVGGPRANPLRQRQQQVLQQRAAAQLQQQFVRRAAAATLQAHWRGWQHRRLARYLRARRKRAMRLDWLWHLEYVTNLLQWHEAAHTVQAAFRTKRDLARRRQDPSFGRPAGRGAAVAPLAAAAAKVPGAVGGGTAAMAAGSAAVKEVDNATSLQPATTAITSAPATAETATGSETEADTATKATGGSDAPIAGNAKAPRQRGTGLGVDEHGRRLTVSARAQTHATHTTHGTRHATQHVHVHVPCSPLPVLPLLPPRALGLRAPTPRVTTSPPPHPAAGGVEGHPSGGAGVLDQPASDGGWAWRPGLGRQVKLWRSLRRCSVGARAATVGDGQQRPAWPVAQCSLGKAA